MAETDWRTIRGVHVLIGEDGTITKGPKNLKGKNLQQELNKRLKRNNENEDDTKEIKSLESELEKLEKQKHELTDRILKIEEEKEEEYGNYLNDENAHFTKKEVQMLNEADGFIQFSDKNSYFYCKNEEWRELYHKQLQLDKKIYKYRDVVENKEAIIRAKNVENLFKSHNFYSPIISEAVDSISGTDLKAMSKAKALIKLDDIARKEGFEISESPYSFSTYALEKGGEITWDSKPTGSYRVSDHWNFESRDKIHCKLSNTNKYTQKLILAKYNGETYDIVEEFE